MTVAPVPERNRLLAALSASVKNRFFSHLQLVDFTLGDVIYESGQSPEYVYFPVNCIISLLHVMSNGASAEISMVGNEGMVGTAVFMGGQHPQPHGCAK